MMLRTYAKYSNDIFIRGSFRAEGFRRIAAEGGFEGRERRWCFYIEEDIKLYTLTSVFAQGCTRFATDIQRKAAILLTRSSRNCPFNRCSRLKQR